MSDSPVIIITGASKGIGKSATLEALEKFNARIVAIARSQALLKELADHVSKTLDKGKQFEFVVGDVTDEKVLHRAVHIAIDKWGRLDSIIANAGVVEPIASISEGPIEGWKRAYEVNVFSVISLIQIALPYLRKSDKGSIVIVSSGAAMKGYKGWGAYGSSKAVINHITNTLSVEEPDITTIAVRPGVVDTDMQKLIRSQGEKAMQENYNKFVDLHREGRLVKPEDPGHVLVAIANNPPKQYSGKMLSWDDEEMKPYRRV